MTLEILQQYVQTLTNEKDEHIIRQLCAVIYRYLEKRGRLPEQKESLCQTGTLTKAGNQ